MKSIEELKAIREKARGDLNLRQEDIGNNTRVVVGMATCGIAAGARPVLASCVEEVHRRGLTDVTVTQTGCIGVCRLEPIVEVFVPGEEKVTYVNMTPEKAAQVIAEHVVNHKVKTEYTIGANQ
ncbi:MAG: (2Fe-2S) ferredoxin domain-containing protein [Oscillospiraceae bacterium]|jgi:NADP-reducing hydrogenase subunit HndB|nr:(2Fe-2S) ferredoxin domain-containing protein [Oscillospiraceae bacterium]